MMGDAGAAMIVRDVRFGYSASATILGPIDAALRPGECWGILGPNGAGKSTLLRLLAGLLRPSSGAVSLGGRPLDELSPRHRARRIAFLPQNLAFEDRFTAREVVLMGRFPHRPWGLFESPGDVIAAEQAMQWTSVTDFADRPLARLSGGERQRVHLAAALAQSPEMLILDEPTASLDLRHQLELLDLLRRRACEVGTLVILATHDLNLAAAYCSHVLLLSCGRTAACGSPEDIFVPALLERVYGVRMAVVVPAGDGETAASSPRSTWMVPLSVSAESRG